MKIDKTDGGIKKLSDSNLPPDPGPQPMGSGGGMAASMSQAKRHLAKQAGGTFAKTRGGK